MALHVPLCGIKHQKGSGLSGRDKGGKKIKVQRQKSNSFGGLQREISMCLNEKMREHLGNPLMQLKVGEIWRTSEGKLNEGAKREEEGWKLILCTGTSEDGLLGKTGGWDN